MGEGKGGKGSRRLEKGEGSRSCEGGGEGGVLSFSCAEGGGKAYLFVRGGKKEGEMGAFAPETNRRKKRRLPDVISSSFY